MKKLVVCSLMILIYISLFSELTETKTISSTLFSDLKDACADLLTGGNGTDEVMTFYYNKLKQTREEGDGDDWRESRASFEPINQASYYATLSLLGAVGRGLEQPNTWEQNLIRSRRFLLDSTFVDYDHPDPNMHNVNMYLDLDSLWVEFDDPDSYSPALGLGTTLINLCFITDMLWHYADSLELYNKLDEIAYYAYLILDADYSYTVFPDTSLFNGIDYPISLKIAYTNARIRLAGALAYAGCILENEDYINTAEHDIFYEECLTVAGTRYGYLDLMTAENGTYCEGMLYTQFTLEGLTPFFTARNRLDLSHLPELDYGANVNWYEEDKVKNLYFNSMDLIGPDFGYLEIDDAVKAGIKRPSGELVPPMTFTQLLTYYYQGTNLEHKANINWFFDTYHDFWDIYPAGLSHFGKIPQLFSYRDITDPGNSVPQNIVNGSLSDSEFTIFRKATSNNYEIYNSPTLIVTHDKSNNYSSHEHSDQGGFMLYYKGKPLLIDPGYRPTWDSNIGREWLHSPFAHNVIMVNPYRTDANHSETVELNDDYWSLAGDWEGWKDVTYNSYEFYWYDFEPIGWYNEVFEDKQKTNPTNKQYFISNHKLQHLKVKIDYDHPRPDSVYNGNELDEIEVNRNYYTIDIEDGNPCFIIYDDLTSSLHNSENEFVNQLHFALYPVNGYNNYYPGDDFLTEESVINSDDGKFEYHNYDNSSNSKLYGATGAINNSNWNVMDSLPQGLYCGAGWDNDFVPPQWEHKCLRINTETSGDEKFLTLLIPSESITNPIDSNYVESGNGYYGVKFDTDSSDDFSTYAGVKSESIGYLTYTAQPQVYVETNAEFFLIEANSDFDDYKKIILNGGNNLELQTNITVFDSDYDFEEMLATYELGGLNVVFKTEWNDHLKYKILRCEVTPQNFSASSYFDKYHSGTQPNPRYYLEHIQSLAYDGYYFYVNYDYSDLENENLLTEELTIYKGIFDNIEITGTSKFGLGEIEFRNEITVPAGTEMKFVPGSHPQMTTDTKFDINGQVTAIGDSLNIIEFDKKSIANWEGFYINSEGAVDFRYCKFTEAEYPIRCFGNIDLENSEITNCDYGLHINSPTSYRVSDNSISDCNNYGVFIGNYSFPVSDSYFEGNTIFNCQFGLLLFNTNTVIDSNMIYNNSDNGMYISHRSHPIIQSSYIGNTRNGAIDNPEIYLIDDSYPVLDYQYNDIIIESGGRSISIYNADEEDNQYYCRENFWGEEISITEISQSFYPEEWDVTFEPICDSSNTGFNPPIGRGGRLFDEGLQAEKEGDLLLAKEKYLLSIDQNPDDLEALWSASRLLNCVDPCIGFGYYEAQQLYEEIMTDSLNLDLYELSKQIAINCDRKMENYQDAIYKYEIMFEDSLSFIDSVFTQLDIVYTYMEAATAGGRASGLCFISDKHAVRNPKHAREMENELLGLLMQETENGGIYSPIIEKVKLHGNYPNPFNPETTISFSIPKESKVEITMYNIKGQKVSTVLKDNMGKGIYDTIWDGKDSNGKSVSSGVYFYKLNVDGKTYAIKKCLLLK
ncbi:MAG: heparinase II/III family protein [Armatimonadetes bacterium]|nr:heparinase II/III family protein [Armatimonadota bacterium]